MKRVGTKSDVQRAIGRSRRARAERRARRRRSAALLGLIAASLGGAGLWSIGAATGTNMVEAAVTQAKSLADLIDQRSPGDRTEAQLTKSRARALQTRHAAAPRQSVRHGPPTHKIDVSADVARLIAGAPLPTVAAQPPTAAPFPDLAMELPPSVGDIVAPPSGGNPPGGGSPPASFPTPQPKSPVIVPSAVPEPGTWATMLLGFGLLGWRMRRRREAPAMALRA